MPSDVNVRARVLDRIKRSANTLTVVYPPARTIPTGTAPGPAPANPLLGTAPALTITGSDPAPSAPSVTMACLWSDMTGVGDARHNAAKLTQMGWQAEADAVAEVALTDAATPTGTVFDACDHVEFRGRHFSVLSVTPAATTFSAPYVYYVWLQGARKQ